MDDIVDTSGRSTVVPLLRTPPPGAEPRVAEGPEPLWRELVGQVLRSERVETHRTLQQVAERAGVSPQYLSEVERGRKDPSSEMLESICGALGLRLADLLAQSGRILHCASPVARPLSTHPRHLASGPVGVVSLAA